MCVCVVGIVCVCVLANQMQGKEGERIYKHLNRIETLEKKALQLNIYRLDLDVIVVDVVIVVVDLCYIFDIKQIYWQLLSLDSHNNIHK